MGETAGTVQRGDKRMKNVVTIEARKFPVTAKSKDGTSILYDKLVLSKQQLQAAQLVGQSSKELIYRIYERNGYIVLDIGRAEKKSLSVDLHDRWEG